LKHLYSFSGGVGGSEDGASPYAGLVQGSNGKLYGTTFYGGASSTGLGTGVWAVFEMTPSGTETVLYSFKTAHAGQFPAMLISGSAGNFYGVTEFGGRAATARPGDRFQQRHVGISRLHARRSPISLSAI
jgi:hypothetical protein